MLDFRAMAIIPGAVLVLGVPGAIAGADGAAVAGVPLKDGANLIGWGMLSPTADSIAHVRLASQDMADPINGEDVSPGAVGLWNGFHKWTNLPYKTGARLITAGTNVGVVAGVSFTMDHYGSGQSIGGDRAYFSPNQVMPPTFVAGAALVANTWGITAFAPAVALPNGKYAILGAYATAFANVAAMRFNHPDFSGLSPGFPLMNNELAAAATLDMTNKDPIWFSQPFQFCYLSEKTGLPCIPVFSATNAGTGLSVSLIAAQAATPQITLCLAKVG